MSLHSVFIKCPSHCEERNVLVFSQPTSEQICPRPPLIATTANVRKLLRNIKPEESFGDSMVTNHLKNCGSALAYQLSRLFKQCLIQGDFPGARKQADVALVAKKTNASEPDQYRPISFLPPLPKFLETLVTLSNAFLKLTT